MEDPPREQELGPTTGPAGNHDSPSEPRFVADVNVGKLAKWLRILGYDTVFINPIDDARLVEIGLTDGRIVLTRDTHIRERRPVASGLVRLVLVQGDRVADQIRFLTAYLGLRHSVEMLTRCIECNVPLAPVERSDVEGRVPPYVWKTQERYVICPRCGKIYWAGTHWDRMRRTARQLLDEG